MFHSFLQHCILTHLAQSKVALHKLTLSCHKCRLHDNNLSPKTEQLARIVQSWSANCDAIRHKRSIWILADYSQCLKICLIVHRKYASSNRSIKLAMLSLSYSVKSDGKSVSRIRLILVLFPISSLNKCSPCALYRQQSSARRYHHSR